MIALSALIVAFYLCSWTFVMLVAFVYNDTSVLQAIATIAVSGLLVTTVIYMSWRKHINSMQQMDGFLIVALSWVSVSFVSSLPILAIFPEVSGVDAWLEAVSGITTTGVEVLGDIATWPKSMLWYRQQLELIGGIGIIVMSISLLSFQEGALLSLYQGAFGKDIREMQVTPRLKGTARHVFVIYGTLWLLCSLAHTLCGAPIFYALLESMATVSTGGFSVSSFYGFYDQALGMWTGIVFMIMGAIGLQTYSLVFVKRNIKALVMHTEVKWMFAIGGGIAAVFLALGLGSSASRVVYDVCSFMTTSGFSTDTHIASPFVSLTFLLLGIIGACSGSTAGGIKIVRFSLLLQDVKLHLKRLVYPNTVAHVSLDGEVVDVSFARSVRGYIVLFIVTFLFFTMVLTALGMGVSSALYWVAATITNVGASVGDIAIGDVNISQKVLLSLSMLIGRVEIAAFLVVCLPKYWR